MKTMLTTITLAVMLAATAVSASCPDTVGSFSTQTGTMSGGRVSEAWCGGAPGQVGNTENAMSWDGATLGGEWKVQGMSIAAAPVEVGSSLDGSGNGWVEYATNYEGGTFWLSKDGAWGDGFNDLTGTVQNYTVTTRIVYVNGDQVGATSNIYFTGQFGDCPGYNGCIIEYTIANAMKNFDADPAAYPPYLCGAEGELFDVCCITTSIHCAVNNEMSSFGQLKSQYR